MTHLNVIIDTLLPGDPELDMPSASSIDFDVYVERHDLVDVVQEFVRMLDKVCGDKFSVSFINLDAAQKMQAINACKLLNIRVFSAGGASVKSLLHFTASTSANWRGKYPALSARKFAVARRLEHPRACVRTRTALS